VAASKLSDADRLSVLVYSGGCDIPLLAPIATILIYLIDSSVLNLMVLKGASVKHVTCLVVAWKC